MIDLAPLRALALVGLLAGVPASDAAEGQRVVVQLELAPGISDALEAVTVSAVASQQGTELVQAEAPAPGAVDLRLAPGLWQLEASLPGYWSTPAIVNVQPGLPASTTLRLWPSGELRGRWLLPEGARRPQTMTVRFLYPATTASRQVHDLAAEGETECRVLVSSHFRCALPIGAWDLRLGASGFAPTYLWNQAVRVQEPTWVGELALRKGGSVAGWIPTCEGSAGEARCSVSVEPMAAGQARDPGVLAGLRMRKVDAAVRSNGFFQLLGVPAGTYVLTARQEGFAPGTVFPVLVLEDRESELRDPMQLQRPLDLQVNLEPAVDPQGQPWKLVLFQHGALPETREEVAAAAQPEGEGIWVWPGLAPGEYDIHVRDGAGTIWDSARFQLDEGSEVLDISLDLVRVNGRVLLGDEGLAARIHWPVSIYMESNEDGDFSGLLARAGEYPVVTVKSAAEQVHWSFPKVQVEVAEGQSAAWVEFRLPDTEVVGTVVDEAGRAVSGALVAPIVNGHMGGSVQTTSQGRFRFRGLPEGDAIVQATSALGDSDPVTLTVAEGLTPPEMHLVVRERREIRGVVVGPGATAIPGARVQAWAPGMLELKTAVTGGDGSFVVELRGGPGTTHFLIQAAGHAYATRSVDLHQRTEVRLQVGQDQGGTLLVDTAISRIRPDAPVSMFLLHNGALVPLGELLAWRDLNGLPPTPGGGRHEIPLVESGDWQICLYPLSAVDISRMKINQQYCTGDYLAPGGELTLDATPLIGEWKKKDDS